ncbi:PREDICTED: (RS)-norcoclaurine 6-O-methyltransferase-like [Tarenaya hassleriana]|uniref:(RS)-norcoclaurine 6-O-methyltransferase-like n=1 Tax=Tarenaya hassleriana TaxID=28532 RepID=UPI00053C1D81|nr:PREDICTED: (RS)-norcoclaurine 6-O-methyltransferase-like [Tarenaya hassleriana]
MEDEEARASVDIWRYAYGFPEMTVVKCAIELKIPEAVESHTSQPVTLAELATAVDCSPPLLGRIMRFLVHQGIFKEVLTKDGLVGYSNTPLSRRMMISNPHDKSLAAFILMDNNPVMRAPWLKLTSLISNSSDEGSQPFEAVYGKDIWAYGAEDPSHNEIFNDTMACDTRRVVPAVARACADVFEGVSTVVDVGGGKGDALGVLVKEFPWIKGFNFDLPHVVETAQKLDRVESVGGDMFKHVPNADLVFLKWILHDWGDEECIKLLRKCKDAVPKGKGKVMIVESVLGKKKDDKLEYVRLMIDIGMMVYTSKGKERTLKEWDYVITEAGFARYEIRDINDVQSVIIAHVS